MTESESNTLSEKEVKTFKDLDKEIIKAGKCCSCGACVAYCEGQAFDVIYMDEFTPKFKSEKNAENCTECGLCYFICPQTETLMDQLNEAHRVEDEIGPVLDVYTARNTEKKIQEVTQDGGVVTTVLRYLFDKHMIDAAVVSEYDEMLNTVPKIIYSGDELLKSSGTRYSLSSQVLPLKDLYNISLEIIEKKGIFDIEQLRIAFVGTPCQVRAISKMKYLHLKPAHVVNYLISLFCYENFNYDKLYELLGKEININPKNIKKTWIKKNFFVRDKNNKEYEVDLKKLDPAVREHCYICDEFTGRFSDISIGASGAPEGYSMIIVRTEKGRNLMNSILSLKYLEQYIIPIDKTKDWKEKKIKLFKRMIVSKKKK